MASGTTPDLTDLIARVEAGEGADRWLDADIELALGNWTPEHHEAWNLWQECGEALPGRPLSIPVDPHWLTTSLDAVLTLVPEGAIWLRLSPDTMTIAFPPADPKGWAVHHEGRSASPARALLAAILRAKAGA